jgi:amino-acid N-acetyltransferase
MNEVQIRPAEASDLATVEALLRAASLPLAGVQDFFPAHYAVATRAGEIVAAIGVETYGSHGLLRSAVVADAARGTGVGSQVTHERLAWSRSRGLQDVYLLTTTAAPFFEKLGFVVVSRAEVPAEVQHAPEFASICPSSAVVMRLKFS